MSIQFYNLENCSKNSSLRIFLFLVLLSSFFVIDFTFDDIFADEKKIISQSISFEDTSIIEFSNNGLEEIKTIKIWLSDSSFKSFKIEEGWSGSATTLQEIIFVTSESIKINETVKFGIKTEKSNPLFHWEVLDKEGNQIEHGETNSQDIWSFRDSQEQNSIQDLTGILSESTFKVVPRNIHPGSTIRVAGDSFVPNSSLELFMSDTRLKSFETDENGHFILTIKIPKKASTEQVDFILKDKQENEKIISRHLTEMEQKILKNIDLTVSEIQDEFYRNEKLELSGTANPNSTVIIKIKNPQGDLFSTETEKTDSEGNWFSSIHAPYYAPIDKYYTEISDGMEIISKSWDVVMSKEIHVFPAKLKFKSEELIKFNGTANSKEQIKIKFDNPEGTEVLSKKIIANPTGFFEIEYQTSSLSSEGTYVLYAFQEHEVEIIWVGLNKSPKTPFSVKLDNVNYHNEDVAVVGITSKDAQELKLSILEQNSNEKFSDKIELGSDGKRNYKLNLTEFSTGVYTLIVSIANFQTSQVFTVGLQSSSIPIDFDMIKKNYNPGQTIYVTGKSQPNTTVNLLLINPDGIVIGEKESFVNKNGDLERSDFIIPYNPMFGNWYIRSESDSKVANFEFQVSPSGNEGSSVYVNDILLSSVGKFVTVGGFVAEEQTVKISFENPDEDIIFKTNIKTTEDGEFDLLWKVPSEYVSGTYSVIVEDSFGKVTSTVFELV